MHAKRGFRGTVERPYWCAKFPPIHSSGKKKYGPLEWSVSPPLLMCSPHIYISKSKIKTTDMNVKNLKEWRVCDWIRGGRKWISLYLKGEETCNCTGQSKGNMYNIVQWGWRYVNWDERRLVDEKNLHEGVLAYKTSAAVWDPWSFFFLMAKLECTVSKRTWCAKEIAG